MRFSNNKGSITFKTLIFLAFVCVVGYIGYKMVPPFFTNMMFKSGINDEIKTAYMFDDNTLAGRIVDVGNNWGLNIDKDNVEINRSDGNISISVKYHVTVNFINGAVWEHDFYVLKAGPLALRQ